MDMDIKLPAMDFSDRTPTKTQIENMCGDIATFLQKVSGSILATNEFTMKDAFVQHMFNAAGGLMAAKEACSANASNIAMPRAVPGGPQRA